MRADQKEITNWLSKTIGDSSFNIKELRQEASDRKYYRINPTDQVGFFGGPLGPYFEFFRKLDISEFRVLTTITFLFCSNYSFFLLNLQ